MTHEEQIHGLIQCTIFVLIWIVAELALIKFCIHRWVEKEREEPEEPECSRPLGEPLDLYYD